MAFQPLLPFVRKISTSGFLRESLSEPLKPPTNSPYVKGMKMWKNLFFFACIPAIVVSLVNVALSEEDPVPEFKKYSYLRIRNKRYPWRDGVKTLFHNPHRNALPDGYEVEPH